MPSAVSRRTLLGGALGLLAAGAAGCSGGGPGTTGAVPTGSAAGSPGTAASLPPGSTGTALTVAVPPAGPTPSATSATTAAPPVPSAAAVPSPAEVPNPVVPPGPSPGPVGPAVEIGTGPTGSSMVALTFHGGGDPATARAILDVCAGRGAHITVLAIGTWLQENPSMAAAILGGGHDLGNHTWSHQVLSDLDGDAVREEITRCRDLLVQLTGSPGSFFRTSSGQHASQLILDEAGTAGYPVCLSYDVDPADWTDPGAAQVRSGAATATAGSIVSLHFGHTGTVQALPGILDDLAARGLRAVTASTLLAS